jgi:ubiquinone/menaquinone biosynthesis C-methylase UbiE
MDREVTSNAMIDWGLGRYERTAEELEPVAEHVVSLADLDNGERVLDLATGTGNAALLAARAGAAVTGLDAAARLIDVARGRATDEGIEATFVVGDVQALPFEDASFDVALSVFGLIFAPDADRAFAEMMRVLRPDGRALFTAWIPAGPIDAMVSVFARALAAATGGSSARFAWHDAQAVSDLVARNGAEVQLRNSELRILAESPEAYLTATEQLHPLSVAGRAALEQAGAAETVREEALAILRKGNEDPAAFRVTTPYRVIEVRHRQH